MQINIRLSDMFGASFGYCEDQHLMAVRGLLFHYRGNRYTSHVNAQKISSLISDIDRILTDDFQYEAEHFSERSPKDLFEHYLLHVSRDWKLLADLRPK